MLIAFQLNAFVPCKLILEHISVLSERDVQGTIPTEGNQREGSLDKQFGDKVPCQGSAQSLQQRPFPSCLLLKSTVTLRNPYIFLEKGNQATNVLNNDWKQSP